MLPFLFDTGSEFSFADEAALVAAGWVTPATRATRWKAMRATVHGREVTLFVRDVETAVEIDGPEVSETEDLRLTLVRDWGESFGRSTDYIGIVGRDALRPEWNLVVTKAGGAHPQPRVSQSMPAGTGLSNEVRSVQQPSISSPTSSSLDSRETSSNLELVRRLVVDYLRRQGAPHSDAEEAANDVIIQVAGSVRLRGLLDTPDEFNQYFVRLGLYAWRTNLRREQQRRQGTTVAPPMKPRPLQALVSLALKGGLTDTKLDYIMLLAIDGLSVNEVAALRQKPVKYVQDELREVVVGLAAHPALDDASDSVADSVAELLSMLAITQ